MSRRSPTLLAALLCMLLMASMLAPIAAQDVELRRGVRLRLTLDDGNTVDGTVIDVVGGVVEFDNGSVAIRIDRSRIVSARSLEAIPVDEVAVSSVGSLGVFKLLATGNRPSPADLVAPHGNSYWEDSIRGYAHTALTAADRDQKLRWARSQHDRMMTGGALQTLDEVLRANPLDGEALDRAHALAAIQPKSLPAAAQYRHRFARQIVMLLQSDGADTPSSEVVVTAFAELSRLPPEARIAASHYALGHLLLMEFQDAALDEPLLLDALFWLLDRGLAHESDPSTEIEAAPRALRVTMLLTLSDAGVELPLSAREIVGPAEFESTHSDSWVGLPASARDKYREQVADRCRGAIRRYSPVATTLEVIELLEATSLLDCLEADVSLDAFPLTSPEITERALRRLRREMADERIRVATFAAAVEFALVTAEHPASVTPFIRACADELSLFAQHQTTPSSIDATLQIARRIRSVAPELSKLPPMEEPLLRIEARHAHELAFRRILRTLDAPRRQIAELRAETRPAGIDALAELRASLGERVGEFDDSRWRDAVEELRDEAAATAVFIRESIDARERAALELERLERESRRAALAEEIRKTARYYIISMDAGHRVLSPYWFSTDGSFPITITGVKSVKRIEVVECEEGNPVALVEADVESRLGAAWSLVLTMRFHDGIWKVSDLTLAD